MPRKRRCFLNSEMLQAHLRLGVLLSALLLLLAGSDLVAVQLWPTGLASEPLYRIMSVDISSCADLNVSGTVYTLNQSLWNVSGTCMNVAADNVTLDCQGHTIDGDDSGFDSGIYDYGYSGAVVKNCVITGFYYGISFYGANASTLLNNTANSNGYGIYFSNSFGDAIANNTARLNAQDGFNFFAFSGNITNNTAESNSGYGFYFNAVSDSSIAENKAYSNAEHGIAFYGSSRNIITGNIANNHASRYGMRIGGDNNTVANNVANNNDYGVYISSSNNNNITNNSAFGNSYGIFLWGSSYNNLTRNNASGNSRGFDVYDGIGNVIADNEAKTSGRTVLLNGGSYNVFRGNNFTSDYEDVIVLYSSNNTFINNTVQSLSPWSDDFDVDASSDSENNTFMNMTTWQNLLSLTFGGGIALKGLNSTMPVPGDPPGYRNISKYVNATNNSAASWLYLNFSYSDGDLGPLDESTLRVWKHDGTWTNETFWSVNGVDTANNIVYANITAFSTFGVFGQVPGLLFGCANLSTPGMNYTINHSLWNVSGTCMNISAHNVTLDCAGLTIDGDDSGTDYGINNLGGYDGVTIKNCIVTDFQYGIEFANGANSGRIINNTASSNTQSGILIAPGSNAIIANNT
ncbi:MAG: NosD domain-containing protein, partial [Candidatus Aenigmatarchaeota archaeon]